MVRVVNRFTNLKAWDIQVQGFYTNQTWMGCWLRELGQKIQNFDGLGLNIAASKKVGPFDLPPYKLGLTAELKYYFVVLKSDR